jgi:hypothetical protein
MSRSLGLREDQQRGEVLATLVNGLFSMEPAWCIREQARSHEEFRRLQGLYSARIDIGRDAAGVDAVLTAKTWSLS